MMMSGGQSQRRPAQAAGGQGPLIGRHAPHLVMAGLVPAIHGLLSHGTTPAAGPVALHWRSKEVVDGRHKAGHDDRGNGKVA